MIRVSAVRAFPQMKPQPAFRRTRFAQPASAGTEALPATRLMTPHPDGAEETRPMGRQSASARTSQGIKAETEPPTSRGAPA